MKRLYAFAGVEISVELPPERMYSEERHLAPFRVDTVAAPHCFRFEIVPSLTPPAGDFAAQTGEFTVYREEKAWVRYVGPSAQPYIRAKHQGKDHQVQLLAESFPGTVGTKTVLNAMAAEHLVVEAGGVILHCSYIDWKGKAILFTAPSETGKSTQAELWRVHRGAEIINGDRAAMRYIAGNATAAGIPFSGSSTYCENRELPLAAIVFLGQAPVTAIRRLKGFEAFRRVWEGCSVNSWDREDMTRASDTVTNILSRVPVFELRCTPDESAVIALERALQEV